MRFGLSKDEITKIEKKFKKDNGGKNVPGKAYLDVQRNALLMIYFIERKNSGKDEGFVIAFGIGIPSLTNEETNYIEYQVNKIYKELEMPNIEEYEDDE